MSIATAEHTTMETQAQELATFDEVVVGDVTVSIEGFETAFDAEPSPEHTLEVAGFNEQHATDAAALSEEEVIDLSDYMADSPDLPTMPGDGGILLELPTRMSRASRKTSAPHSRTAAAAHRLEMKAGVRAI